MLICNSSLAPIAFSTTWLPRQLRRRVLLFFAGKFRDGYKIGLLPKLLTAEFFRMERGGWRSPPLRDAGDCEN